VSRDVCEAVEAPKGSLESEKHPRVPCPKYWTNVDISAY